MITTVKQAEQIAKEYNAITTDKERLSFLKSQGTNMKVVLDNDYTAVCFNDVFTEDEVQTEAINNIELNGFDYYHGWADAIVELFEFAGITAEQC